MEPGCSSMWKCNLCSDQLKSPVVLGCGHVLCWRCLCNWRKDSDVCPLCNEKLEEEKITPIYGHGIDDPHLEDLPPLPKSEENETNERTESVHMDEEPVFRGQRQNFQWNYQNRNGNVQFGFGFVPFGVGMTFGTMGGMNPPFRQFPNQEQPRRNFDNNYRRIISMVLIIVFIHIVSNFI